MKNPPNHEEYERMVEWLGGTYDPADFNLKRIIFSDPKKRLKIS